MQGLKSLQFRQHIRNALVWLPTAALASSILALTLMMAQYSVPGLTLNPVYINVLFCSLAWSVLMGAAVLFLERTDSKPPLPTQEAYDAMKRLKRPRGLEIPPEPEPDISEILFAPPTANIFPPDDPEEVIVDDFQSPLGNVLNAYKASLAPSEPAQEPVSEEKKEPVHIQLPRLWEPEIQLQKVFAKAAIPSPLYGIEQDKEGADCISGDGENNWVVYRCVRDGYEDIEVFTSGQAACKRLAERVRARMNSNL